MIYAIRTELEQGLGLLAEAEEALKKGEIDAGKLSRLENLLSPTDAMMILRRQPAFRERFAKALAGLEDYKARHPLQTAPADASDYFMLENICFRDADGKVVESRPRLYVKKDIEKDGKGQILFFTAYDAEKHFEQKGMSNMSLPEHCFFLSYLWHNKENSECMRALIMYKDKGNGNGGHKPNLLINYGGQVVIHRPNDSDFPSCGGNSNINAGRRIALPFLRKGLKSMPLEKALEIPAASRFVKQLTCMEHPEELVAIGKLFGKEACLWVPNGDAADYDETRAAWLGCSINNFDLSAYGYLYSSGAARGVSASPQGEP